MLLLARNVHTTTRPPVPFAFAAFFRVAFLCCVRALNAASEQAGNNFMAYCEQAEAVAPAFRPDITHGARTTVSIGDGARPGTFPGEVNRADFMEMLTPFVKIGLNRRLSWSLDEHGKTNKRDPLWINTINWSEFRDRYMPILHGAFHAAYHRHPHSLWPLPTN